MKKFLALSVLLGSSIMFVPSAEAKTATTAENIGSAVELNASVAPQFQRNRQWQRNRRVRIVTRTRIVRVGYRTYREVVQYRYFGNGRVTVRVLSRTRIR